MAVEKFRIVEVVTISVIQGMSPFDGVHTVSYIGLSMPIIRFFLRPSRWRHWQALKEFWRHL